METLKVRWLHGFRQPSQGHSGTERFVSSGRATNKTLAEVRYSHEGHDHPIHRGGSILYPNGGFNTLLGSRPLEVVGYEMRPTGRWESCLKDKTLNSWPMSSRRIPGGQVNRSGNGIATVNTVQ